MEESVDLAEEAGRQDKQRWSRNWKICAGAEIKKTLNTRLTGGERFKRMEEILWVTERV